MRRTIRRHLGYTPINPDTSPMLLYSNYHWHYNLPQGMEMPKVVNRRIAAPYINFTPNVNRHRGVWIDLDMPAAYRVALAPQLEKLALGRTIPKTDIAEAVKDFESLASLISEANVRDAWMAKVIQLSGFRQKGDVALDLWNKHCSSRFAAASSKPPLPLIISLLFSLGASASAEWKVTFRQCLKDHWNITPQFPTALWEILLRCAGVLGDQAGVVMLLEEMIDVHADVEKASHDSLAWALNAIDGVAEYDFAKKWLFHLSERKTEKLSRAYAGLRSRETEGFKDNDKMFYHVQWHASIRQPRQFSPRQLYFDYQPSALSKSSHNPNAKIDTVVKEKIERWKQEGLLPEDYEYTDKVYDKSAAYKNVMRQEKWKKAPKMLKSERFGYSGEM